MLQKARHLCQFADDLGISIWSSVFFFTNRIFERLLWHWFRNTPKLSNSGLPFHFTLVWNVVSGKSINFCHEYQWNEIEQLRNHSNQIGIEVNVSIQSTWLTSKWIIISEQCPSIVSIDLHSVCTVACWFLWPINNVSQRLIDFSLFQNALALTSFNFRIHKMNGTKQQNILDLLLLLLALASERRSALKQNRIKLYHSQWSSNMIERSKKNREYVCEFDFEYECKAIREEKWKTEKWTPNTHKTKMWREAKQKYSEREQITKYRRYSIIIICDFIHFMNIGIIIQIHVPCQFEQRSVRFTKCFFFLVVRWFIFNYSIQS